MSENVEKGQMALYPEGVEYYDPENCACDSVATSFLMYKVGAPRDFWYPSAIDTISGRKPGQPTDSHAVFRNLLALLEKGAEIVELCPFESERLKREGLAYVEEFCSDSWLKEDPASFYNYWGSGNLELFTEAYANFDDRVRNDFKSSYQTIHRSAEIADIRQYIAEGYAAKCILKSNRGAGISHAVVVTDIDPPGLYDGVDVFDPNLARRAGLQGPIVSRDIGDFTEKWMPAEGTFAVRRFDPNQNTAAI